MGPEAGSPPTGESMRVSPHPEGWGRGEGECRCAHACPAGSCLHTPRDQCLTYLEKAETITFLEPALPTFAPV